MALDAGLDGEVPIPRKFADHDPCHGIDVLAQNIPSLLSEAMSTDGAETGALAQVRFSKVAVTVVHAETVEADAERGEFGQVRTLSCGSARGRRQLRSMFLTAYSDESILPP
ncbi:MAG: hypothetical protein OXI95_15230 [bacterium]|nr:hypothetical protein [bacterium]